MRAGARATIVAALALVAALAMGGCGADKTSGKGAALTGSSRPRVDGSVLMIAPAHGGLLLTAVLNPDVLDSGAWHVRTAWPASTAQANRYHRDR